ncbi:hypothetical protein Bca4012_018827 [Brassica carinata]
MTSSMCFSIMTISVSFVKIQLRQSPSAPHPRPLSDLSSTISLNSAIDNLSHFCCILFSSSSRYITSAVLFD